MPPSSLDSLSLQMRRSAFILALLFWLGMPSPALAAEGDILVLDGTFLGVGSGAIIRVDRATGTQGGLLPAQSLSQPVAFGVEVSGDVVVLENCCSSRARIVRIDPTLGQRSVILAEGYSDDPVDLAIEPNGTLLATDSYCCIGDSGIGRFGWIRTDPVTGDQTVLAAIPNSNLGLELRTTVMPDGAIYGVRAAPQGFSSVTYQLLRTDPATGQQTVVPTTVPIPFAFDLAATVNGDLIVVGGENATAGVALIRPSTGSVTAISTGGQLQNPMRVAVSPAGQIAVLDHRSGVGPAPRVILVDPQTGSQQVLTTGQLIAAPVDIAFEGPTRAPVAPRGQIDGYVVAHNTVLAVSPPGVLANDGIPSGAVATVTQVRGPRNGSLSLRPDGGFTYTPSGGFVGFDSFVYRASVGAAVSNPVLVSINVREPPPSAGEVLIAGADCCSDAGAVIRVNPVTGQQIRLTRGGFLRSEPVGMAILPSSEIVVADPRCCGGSGGLVGISPLTGQQRVISRYGDSFLRAVAVSSTGELFALRQGISELARIDPVSGASTRVARFSEVTLGMAMDRDDTFVIAFSGFNAPGGRASVQRFNARTGQLTLIARGGLLGIPTDVGIASDGGILLADGSRLLRIEPATGAQRVVSQNGKLSFLGDIAIGLRGEILLLGACCGVENQALFQIDPVTGSQATLARGNLLSFPRAMAVVRPTANQPQPAASPGPSLGDDDTDKPHRETETQRQQRQRTNRSGHDDEHTEGNVIEANLNGRPPTVVIATRDGLVTVELRCGSSCPSVKVGDYVTVDGAKIDEEHYVADDIEVE